MVHEISPEPILHVGLGYMASKTLLTAVELDVFTRLAKGLCEGVDVAGALGLHPRGAADFLDALVALGFLERTGTEYRNSPSADAFLGGRTAHLRRHRAGADPARLGPGRGSTRIEPLMGGYSMLVGIK
jgi:hypothetical protein